MDRCIVSLATSDRQFPAALARQQASVRAVGYTGGFLTWPPGEWPHGCPGHFESPFAFKPFCLREAERRGAECALWLDASCVAVRSLDPLFEKIHRDGYLLFRNRGTLGEWAGDLALDAFGVSRSRAMKLGEVNAGSPG